MRFGLWKYCVFTVTPAKPVAPRRAAVIDLDASFSVVASIATAAAATAAATATVAVAAATSPSCVAGLNASPGGWIKHIFGVLICGALIALGNWIYTLFSSQWAQAGMPELPVMVSRPGGQPFVPNQTGQSGQRTINIGMGGQPQASTPRSSFMDEYRD